MDLSKIEGRTITNGNHKHPEDGMCIMEATAYVMGESFTDFPLCTPHEVSRLAQRINDGFWASDEERTTELAPLIQMLVSCERSNMASRIRAFMCADRGRLWAADAIELRGFAGHADRIRRLAPIVDKSTAEDARDAVQEIRIELRSSAADAADAAAIGAIGAAAGDAAYAAYAYAAAAVADGVADAYAAGYADAADAAKIKRRAERIELLVAMCQVRT